MRVSREQVEANQARILDVATKLFRERGIDGTSISDLMKSAGLTHGGFYGHFKSKDDLVAQASGGAFSKMRQNWMRVIDGAKGEPLEALTETYLSPQHRDHAGRGCPMAALGSDFSRQSLTVRHSVTEELRPFLDYLTRILPGRSKAARRKKALATYATLVGALVVARAVDDPALSNEVLHAAADSVRGTDVESLV
jgi:TetR/AcrR family transcriptional repressor of nem operon